MVDIIILCHSEPLITKKCFKALFKYTKEKDFRLIIVDNGADVETKKVIKSFLREQDKLVTMLTNVGFSRGVNRALDEVKSKYFCLLNNDVLVSPNWLERMKKKLDESPCNAGAIGAISNFASGKQRLVPEDIEKNVTEDNYIQFKPTLDPRLILDTSGKLEDLDYKHNEDTWIAPTLAFFAVLFKSKLIKEVGKLDETFSPAYCEDWDYSFRMSEKGYALLVDRETFVWHYGEATAKNILDRTSMYKVSNSKLEKKWGIPYINKKFSIDRDFRRLNPNSVTLAVPNTGMFSHYAYFNALSLIKPPDTVLCDIPRTVVHFARNEAVKVALLNNTNYVFFLDSDVKYPSNILMQLLRYNKDLVGAVVTKRVPPYNPCVYKGRQKMEKLDEIGWTWLSKIGVGLQEIDGIGMAATLIKTKIFKQLKQPWFYFTEYIGEDLKFCDRIQKLGFKLFCDTDILCLHEGELQFKGWKDFVEWAKQNGGTLITGKTKEDLEKKVKEHEEEVK